MGHSALYFGKGRGKTLTASIAQLYRRSLQLILHKPMLSWAPAPHLSPLKVECPCVLHQPPLADTLGHAEARVKAHLYALFEGETRPQTQCHRHR